jgi:hypothetical protein
MNLGPLFAGVLIAALVVGCGERGPIGPPETTVQSGPSGAPVMGNGVDIDLVADGVGLFNQPAGFSLNVPVSDTSEIVQAHFYWSGRSRAAQLPGGDDTIVINGVEYTGDVQAAYLVNNETRYTFFYRLDAVAAGLVQPGMNMYEVEGFDLGSYGLTDGIGLAVVYESPGSGYSEIDIIEPNEFLYYDDPDFTQGAVQGFLFAPSDMDRIGRLVVFVGDCKPDRPDKLWWTTGTGTVPGNLIDGPYPFVADEFRAANGPEFDVFTLESIPVTAGSDYFAYQLNSPPPGNGDSFQHTFGAFCVQDVDIPPPRWRMAITAGTLTRIATSSAAKPAPRRAPSRSPGVSGHTTSSAESTTGSSSTPARRALPPARRST